MKFISLLLQTSGITVPIWVAVIGALGVVVSPIVAGLITWFFNRRKTAIEIKKEESNLHKTALDNIEFENEAFNDAQVLIKSYQSKILEDSQLIHQLKSNLSIKDLEIAQMTGAKNQLLSERETVTLANIKITEENNKIKQELNAVIERLNVIVKVIKESQLEFPSEYVWALEPLDKHKD